jgi:integrase
MATVRKRRSRSGEIVYQAVWHEAGPGRRQKAKNFAKAADAKAHAAEMEATIERRGVADPERHTVARYLKRWLTTLQDRGEHSETTLDGYGRCIDLASRFLGEIPLAKLTAHDIDHAYSAMLKRGGKVRGKKTTRPLTGRTVLNVHRCLHTALEQARKWKLIAENPARDARAPTPRKSTVRALTADEMQRLLDAAGDPETYCIIGTILACGLRRSELIGLAFDAIDLDAGTLTVSRTVVAVNHQPVLRERAKTESSLRTLALPAELLELLREQRARVAENMLAWGRQYQRTPLFVFPGLAGTPMIPSSLTHRLRQVMRRAKVKAASPCHAWRHSAATTLLDSGQNIKTVQNRLGHSTPAITLALYVHPVAERDREAAEHFGGILKRPKART